MRSTAWYFDHEGNLIEYTGTTWQHGLYQSLPEWNGPFSSMEAAVHVWEFRESERAR